MKPLKRKIYDSIALMPGSRLGPSDKQANPSHVRIATEKTRDHHDIVMVQESLDGSNVGVTKLGDGSIVPLTIAGYEAVTSPYEQHHYWAVWVWEHADRFDKLLLPNDWCVGEWCIQAHSTKYVFPDEPFFLFDLFHKGERLIFSELMERNESVRKPFNHPVTYMPESGGAIPLETILEWLEQNPYGHHGAVEPSEGYVWRVERKNQVDFLIKYVRPDKQDGVYLPELSGRDPVYNYWEDPSECIKHLRNKELLRKNEPPPTEKPTERKFIRRR